MKPERGEHPSDELIVRYRNGELLAAVRRREKWMAALMVLPFAISLALAITLRMLGAGGLLVGMFVVFTVVQAALAVGLFSGRMTPRYARQEAPGGIAWILRPSGVTITFPDGEAELPWPDVEVITSKVSGMDVVRVGSEHASTAYPAAHLSHDADQILAAAQGFAGA